MRKRGSAFSKKWSRESVFCFQAEDGIRDSSVTGVQTCALPISRSLLNAICPPAFIVHFKIVRTTATMEYNIVLCYINHFLPLHIIANIHYLVVYDSRWPFIIIDNGCKPEICRISKTSTHEGQKRVPSPRHANSLLGRRYTAQ